MSAAIKKTVTDGRYLISSENQPLTWARRLYTEPQTAAAEREGLRQLTKP
jgi:predicted transcriptional regulator